MQVTRFENAAEFADYTSAFLQVREAEHNLMLGITTTLLKSDEYQLPPYLACVEDAGRVVAVALRTPPHNLVLSNMASTTPIDPIAQAVRDEFATLPGVTGPKPVSRTFAERWQALTDRHHHFHMAMRIYRLTTVQPVTGIRGTLHRATIHERDLLVQWMYGFNLEALGVADLEEAEQSVDHALASRLKGLYLWCDDTQPVSLAGVTGPTPHGIRVGPVYTPPEYRSRGYASAAVAAVSQAMLDGGRQFCFLHTDLSNPTSNRIYQAIGYKPVSDVDEYRFEE